jgi:hypothetical protein
MDSVMYIRKRPWRPRRPRFGQHAGARRRGFRQDELSPAPDARHDDIDVVIEVEAAAGAAPVDDVVLAETVTESAAQSAVPARVDVSGLLAISSIAPEPVSLAHEDAILPTTDWHAHGGRDDEAPLLTRHSA